MLSRVSEIPKSRFRVLYEHSRNRPPSSSRIVDVGSPRRQLAGLRARSAAELRVVLVRAILGRHDQLAIGEERVILAMGMNENTWKDQSRQLNANKWFVSRKCIDISRNHLPATRMSTLSESEESSLAASHRYRPESSRFASLIISRLSSENKNALSSFIFLQKI